MTTQNMHPRVKQCLSPLLSAVVDLVNQYRIQVTQLGKIESTICKFAHPFLRKSEARQIIIC